MKTHYLTAAGLVLAMSAFGASAADVDRGKKMASQWCSSCHLVKPEQTASGDGAPTFNSIAQTAAERSSDLRAWLADPHPPMPNLDLSVREIDDLLAYIESLRSD